jgi:Rieske Fe-S protein
MAEAARSRRSTLRALIVSGLGLGALWRFFSPRRPAAGAQPVVSVAEADVPVRGALVLPDERIAVVNDGRSWYALDLRCTHLGCTVKGTAGGFACPCHGSRFTSAGEVAQGPATHSLRRLAASRSAGRVTVVRGPA